MSIRQQVSWRFSFFLYCQPFWTVQTLTSTLLSLGFHLSGKRWVELAVDQVQDIQKLKDPSAFQSLELLGSQKNLISKLVSWHGVRDDNRSMRDLMDGKGNGLVILLHGMFSLIYTFCPY